MLTNKLLNYGYFMSRFIKALAILNANIKYIASVTKIALGIFDVTQTQIPLLYVAT